MSILVLLGRVIIKLLAVASEGMFWAGRAALSGLRIGGDAWSARKALAGTVRCPRGHQLETEGLYECEQCGYRYAGSIWLCGNPQCGATTPFINCESCRLSVPSPYRLGRP